MRCFAFIGKGRDKLKILFWNKNGLSFGTK